MTQATVAADATVPFLKWAGGKRWLVTNYSTVLPTSYERYFEPFLGGGAVFFRMQPSRSILSDKNADLINVYQQIKSNWKEIDRALRRMQRLHSKEFYYEERARSRRSPLTRAVQFLYLNRTCWNGLYRVNLRGEFNVPIGTKSSVVLDSDDFEQISHLLEGAELRAADFETTLNLAVEGDFVFIDPPYVTGHNFNGFVKYNEDIFSWADQVRLATAVRRAAARGVMVLVTNAAHKSIRELYRGLGSQRELIRTSVLAGNSSDRRVTSELAILVNYEAGS